MQETEANTVKDIWMLPTNVAVIGYILVATFLLGILNFDLEISEIIKALSVTIFFVLSLILAYSYKQALKKFKVYERIFEEFLASSPFPNRESKQAGTSRKYWQKSLNKCKVRRSSYPIAFFEYSSFQHSCKHGPLNGNLQSNRHQLKTETGMASLNEANGTSRKGYDEIRVILHNCAKDLDNIIKSVKSLNLAYMKNFEDTSSLNQNSALVPRKVNLDSQITVKREVLPLKNAMPQKENSCTTVSIISLPQTLHTDLNTKGKQIKIIKLDPSISLNHWKNLLQFGGTFNVPEIIEKEFFKITKTVRENFSTATRIISLPQASHQDLGTRGKPIKSIKMVPENCLTHCLWKYLLQNGGTHNVTESVQKEFLFKSILLDIKESGYSFQRIPPNKQDLFCRQSIDSLLQIGKLIMNFYKTKAVVRHDVRLTVSFKKHVPKIPMRPYVRQITMTKYMQKLSRERYIYSLSMRESKINSKQTVSTDSRKIFRVLQTVPAQGFITSVDEMLLSVKQSLTDTMADSSTSSNEILISKFEETDFKNFVGVHQELNDH